ncbi:MAG TPA: hypothetical protein VMR62_19400 [Bryobacteraceae bacterium]|jgi:hypothetical protein|nr:hypothetical protein [Bryobacteraceae bacterium]
MSTVNGQPRLTVADLAARCRGQFIPVNHTFSYFCTPSMAEEDLRQYLHDPIAALSLVLCSDLGTVGLVLVPYLEKGNVRAGDLVNFEKPAEGRQLTVSRLNAGDMTILALATKEEEIANYHYTFYNSLAAVIANKWDFETRESFYRQLREELSAEVHGEVDERSWHLKQSLTRRQANIRKETKLFRDYARQAFEDTLTLYMHGTCCDIDVETGPRQMPSRYLRKRLELLCAMYPPPEGYAVFPEQLKKR